jgi:hypothetical protein
MRGCAIGWRLRARRDNAKPEEHASKQTDHLSGSHDNLTPTMTVDPV